MIASADLSMESEPLPDVEVAAEILGRLVASVVTATQEAGNSLRLVLALAHVLTRSRQAGVAVRSERIDTPCGYVGLGGGIAPVASC